MAAESINRQSVMLTGNMSRLPDPSN